MCGEGWQDNGKRGVQKEGARRRNTRADAECGWHGCFRYTCHGFVVVGEGREGNTVCWTPEVRIECEPDVVVAECVCRRGREITIEFRAVSLLRLVISRLERLIWSFRRVPGVEFIAPGAEPVAGKRALYYGLDNPPLLESVLASVNMSHEYICTKSVVNVST